MDVGGYWWALVGVGLAELVLVGVGGRWCLATRKRLRATSNNGGLRKLLWCPGWDSVDRKLAMAVCRVNPT